MNHIFRVVRRKSDGLLVVASEMAKNAVGGSSITKVASLITMLLSSNAVWATISDIEVDSAITTNATLATGQAFLTETTTTDVSVVNVVAPNSDAVSHNVFTKLNVNSDGVIINNAQATATSQIMYGDSSVATGSATNRGDLAANSNFSSTEAKLIILEVSGANAASFAGSMEVVRSDVTGETVVVGQDSNGVDITKAVTKTTDLIIAVPGGISLNGASFVGTDNVVLSAASVGALDGLKVPLTMTANGVTIADHNTGDTSLSATDLAILAAKINIDGKIEANTIKIVATDDTATFDASDSSVTSTNTTTVNTGGVYAIDSSALGGMYAGRITLIANELGTGVRVRGDMAALGDAITITADGNLIVGEVDDVSGAVTDISANTLAVSSANGGDISLADAEINMAETTLTGGGIPGGAINITTTGDLTVDTVNMAAKAETSGATRGDITLTAAKLTDKTTTSGPYNRIADGAMKVDITGAIDVDNASYSGNTQDIDADSLALGVDATIYAKTTGSIDAVQGISLAGTVQFASGTGAVTAGTGDLAIATGAEVRGDDLTLKSLASSGTVSIASGVTVATGGDLSLLAKTITSDSSISATGNLTLGDGTTTAVTMGANNTGAILSVAGNLNIDAATVALHGSAAVTQTSTIGTTANGPVTSFTLASTGRITSQTGLVIDATTADIGGQVVQDANIQVAAATSLSIDKDAALIAGGTGTVTLTSASINNAGQVQAAGTLTIGDGSNADVTNTGSLKAAGNISLDIGTGLAFNKAAITSSANDRNLGKLYDPVNETSATTETFEQTHTIDIAQIGLIDSSGGSVTVSAANFVNEGEVKANTSLDLSATNYQQMLGGIWDWAASNSVTSFTAGTLMSDVEKYDYVDQPGTLSYAQDQYILAGRANFTPTTSAASLALGSGTHVNVGGSLSNGTLPTVDVSIARTSTTSIAPATVDTSNSTVSLTGAPVVADGSTTTQVELASNNSTWMVHIASPNSQGLSNNTYTSFNVNANGLILNNMPVANSVTVVTDLSAVVVANPNLTTSASVILNQVTGTSSSIFNGFMEIAGSNADLIIANPYGLVCNDCGVINADRIDLVVGSVSLGNGQVTDFSTNYNGSAATGTFRVLGSGLDLSRSKVASVIAPEVIIDGNLNAKILYTGIGSGDFSRLSSTGASASGYYGRTATTNNGTNADALLVTETAGIFADDMVIDVDSGSQNPRIRILGEIAASTGVLDISTDGMVVVQGRLSSAKDLNIVTTSSTNSKNPVGADIQLMSGSITAGEDMLLKADAGSMYFGGGQLYGFKDLTLDSLILLDKPSGNTATFNNTRYAAGTLNLNIDNELSLDGTSWQADTMVVNGTNLDMSVASGTKLIADTLFDLDIKNLTNIGTIVSSKQLDLDATTKVQNNTSGVIKAVTGSTLTTPLLYNYGTWMASTDTAASGSAIWKVDTLQNKRTGTLSSAQAWSIEGTNGGATGSLANEGTIASQKELDATLTTLNNTGSLTLSTRDSGGTSNWITTNFTNSSSGTLFAGDDWVVNSSSSRGSSLNNSGVMQGYKDLHLSFATLNVATGKDISGALAGVTGDSMVLNISNLYSLDTLLYSNADLQANFDAGINITASGALVGNGSTTLASTGSNADIINYGFIYGGADLTLTAADDIGNFVGISLQDGRVLGVSNITGKRYVEAKQIEKSRSDIRSGGDLTMTAGDLFVNSSEIRAGGALAINANKVSNQVQRTSESGFNTDNPLTETVGKRLNYTSSTTTTDSYQYPDNYTNYRYDYTWDEFNYFKEGAPAVTPQIIATDSFSITAADVFNYGGLIQATAGTNSSSIAASNSTVNDALALWRDDYTWTKTREVHWAAFGPAKHSDSITGGANAPTSGSNVELDKGGAAIKSSGSLSIASGSVTNTGSVALGDALTAANVSSSASATTALNPNGFTLNVSLPSNPNGFFVTSRDPSAKYVVEMNPKLQPGISTLGSDYLMSSLNIDNDSTIKRLGDASYEAYMVEQQLIEATGRSVLDGYGNMADTMQGFMDNAAQQAKNSGFTFGKPLSDKQVASLTQPIVWMVEVEVNGQTVLAPKVYLPADLIAQIDGESATIAANDLDMDVDTLDNVGGTISAEENLNITAKGDITNLSGSISGGNVSVTSTEGDIINETYNQYAGNDLVGQTDIGKTASISATNNLNVDAAGNITNLGATMEAGGDASLTAGGDITFDTIEDTTKTYSMSGSSGGFTSTFSETKTSDTKQVRSGLTVGGDLSTDSGGDTTFAGTNVAVEGDADINAGGGINIIARENVSTVDTTSRTAGLGVGGGVYGTSMTTTNATSIRNQGSTFDVGGDASFKAEDDLTIQGSDLNVAGSADIQADSLVVVAGRDVDTYSSRTETTSFVGGDDSKVGESADGSSADGLTLSQTTIETTEKLSQRSQASNLNIGNNLTVNVEQDVILQGSNVEAGGDVDIDAQNIFMLAAQNIEEETNEVTTIRTGLYASSETDAQGEAKAGVGTSLDYSAEAGIESDVNGVNSSGSANAEASASAGANAGASAKGSASANATLDLLRVQTNKTYNLDITNTGSTIKSGGKLNLNAEQDILLIGSELEAEGDVTLDATNMMFAAAEDISISEKTSETTRMGLYADSGAEGEASASAKAGANAEANAGANGSMSASTGASAAASAKAEAKAKAEANAEAKAGVGIQTKHAKKVETTTSTTAALSSIKSNSGSITRNAEEAIIDVGTEIEAAGDLNQSAETIASFAARNETTTSTSYEETTVKVGVYVEAKGEAKAEAGASAEAEGEVGGSLGSGPGSEKKASAKAGAEAKAEGRASAGVEMQMSRLVENQTETSSTAVVSTIKVGGDINSESSGGTIMEGTVVEAGGDINLSAEELELRAARDEYSKTSSSESISGRVAVSIGVGGEAEASAKASSDGKAEGKADAGGGVKARVEMEMSLSKSDEQENSTTAVTGSLSGSNINITTTKATVIEGADLNAEDSINVDAESLDFKAAQNTSSSSSSSLDVDVALEVEATIIGSGDLEVDAEASVDVANAQASGTEAVTGSINASNLNITTKKDVRLEGTEVDVTDNAAIDAGGNIELVAARNTSQASDSGTSVSAEFSLGEQSASADVGVNSSREQSDEAVVGSLNIGGNLTLKSGNDIVLEGTDVAVDGDATVAAENDVTFKAARSTSSSSSNNVEVGVGGSMKKKELNANVLVESESESANEANAGSFSANNLTIVAGNDATFEGTEMAAEGEATVVAKGDVTFSAAESTYESKSDGVDVGVGLSKKSVSANVGVTDKDSRQTVAEAGSLSGNNLTIVAGENASFEGTDLAAKNDATIAAGGSVEFTAARSTLESTDLGVEVGVSVGKKKNSLSAGVNIGNESANIGEAGSINAGNNIAIVSGDDIAFEGTELGAGNGISVAAAGDVTFAAVESTSSSTNVGVGIDVGTSSSSSKDKKTGKTTDKEGASAGFDLSLGLASSREQTGSDINAGEGGITIQSGGDVTLQGTQASTNGAMDVSAEGEIKQSSVSSESSSFGLEVSASVETETETTTQGEPEPEEGTADKGSTDKKADSKDDSTTTDTASAEAAPEPDEAPAAGEDDQAKQDTTDGEGETKEEAEPEVEEETTFEAELAVESESESSTTDTELEAAEGVTLTEGAVAGIIQGVEVMATPQVLADGSQRAIIPGAMTIPAGTKVLLLGPDGQPMPTWVKFDATLGAVVAKPPADFTGSLEIIINVPQSDGSMSKVGVRVGE